MLQKDLTLPFSKKNAKISPIFFNILFYLIIGITFLGCVDLFSQQGLLILISIVLMGVYVLLKGKLTLNIPFFASILFGILYCIGIVIYTDIGILSIVVACLVLPVSVQFFNCFDNKKKLLIWLSGAYVLGFFVSFLLMVLSSYWHQGPALSGDAVNSFWDKGVIITRTALSINEIAFFGLILAVLFFKNRFRTWYSVPILLFFALLCVFVSLKIGNRSFLVALFILIYVILIQKFFMPNENFVWTFLLILFNVFFISLCCIYVLYHKNLIQIPENLMNIKIINRIFAENLSEGRPELWVEFFQNFYKYPFGGLTNQMSNRYAHNLLLDFYTFGGFIPFIITTSFFVFLFIYLVYFLRLTEAHSLFERAAIVCVIASYLGLGMIEPIYQANPHCLTPLFILFLYLRHCRCTEKLPVKAPVVLPFTDIEPNIFEKVYYLFKNLLINSYFKSSKISLSTKFKSKNLGGNNMVGRKTTFVGEIGVNSSIGNGCRLYANIKDNSNIGSNVRIILDKEQEKSFNKKNKKYLIVKNIPPINIGSNVIIGNNVKIKAGVTISDNAVIVDDSVITLNI